MRVVKAVLILLTIWLIVVFTEQNAGARFNLIIFGRSMGDTSAVEALLGAFLLGIVVAGAYSLNNYSVLSKKYKSVLYDNDRLEKDVSELRMMQIDDSNEKKRPTEE